MSVWIKLDNLHKEYSPFAVRAFWHDEQGKTNMRFFLFKNALEAEEFKQWAREEYSSFPDEDLPEIHWDLLVLPLSRDREERRAMRGIFFPKYTESSGEL